MALFYKNTYVSQMVFEIVISATIDESVQEHFTQILFILKESYTDSKKGFLGWQPFTEEYLTEICEKDYAIYKSEWGPDGQQFVKMFPEKIKEFLHTYCDKNN